METTNVVFAGVGGQGVLLASDVLADVALRQGLDVKKSEVHGMSQRGGSVISQVRFGEKIYSPLIAQNQADVIVAFEKLEAVRYLNLLRPNGLMIVNAYEIIPESIQYEKVPYPHDILPLCSRKTDRVILHDYTQLATRLGNAKALNVTMLGTLSRYLSIPEEVWIQSIRARVPQRFLELNLTAFSEGRQIVLEKERQNSQQFV